MPRCRHTGLRAVFAFADGFELYDAQLPLAGLQQRAYNGAHHVAQKAVGGNPENIFVLIQFFPDGFGDAAVVGKRLGIHLAEAREVGNREQMRCGLVHELNVQLAEYIQGGVEEERIFLPVNVVAVASPFGIEAGAGFRLHRVNLPDRNFVRQYLIELVDTIGRRKVQIVFRGVEVSVVIFGMHAGIGAAAAGNVYGFSQDHREFLAKHLLHGVRRIILFLPTVVVGAVIGKLDKIARHGRKDKHLPGYRMRCGRSSGPGDGTMVCLLSGLLFKGSPSGRLSIDRKCRRSSSPVRRSSGKEPHCIGKAGSHRRFGSAKANR